MKPMFLRLFAAPVLLTALFNSLCAQRVTPNDGNWKEKILVLKNTPEAEVMIRVGDIDNLNYGFPEGFNPFCGITTEVHDYPWEVDNSDPEGTDRILIGTAYGRKTSPCEGSADGYSSTALKTRPISVPTAALKDKTIRNAALMIFIDDFQAPVFCSKFQFTLNGIRFPEAENLINSVSQTGPVGKLVIIPLTPNLLPQLNKDQCKLWFDDPETGAADGFAIDFAKLVVNYNPVYACIGDVSGVVKDADTFVPLADAAVEVYGFGTATTDKEGRFSIPGIPASYHVASASANGYESGSVSVEVMEGQTAEVEIDLKRSHKKTTFNNKTVCEGETIAFGNILFETGSARLLETSKQELMKIVDFMKANPGAVIHLSGHTSSEGERNYNIRLSFDRVNSCRDFISANGLDVGRITVSGHGPDRPVASNSTEEGRKANRRVEMRILKL